MDKTTARGLLLCDLLVDNDLVSRWVVKSDTTPISEYDLARSGTRPSRSLCGKYHVMEGTYLN